MSIDWSSFFPTLLATSLGIGLAFLLNGIYNSKAEKTRARKLLFLLKDEIKSNHDLLLELEGELKDENWTPFYDLRFVVWNSITPNIAPVLKKLNIIKEISRFYYELQHIERKIDGLFNVTFNSNITTDTMVTRKQFIDSLNVHIPGVLMGRNCKSPQVLINEIEHLIRELKKYF